MRSWNEQKTSQIVGFFLLLHLLTARSCLQSILMLVDEDAATNKAGAASAANTIGAGGCFTSSY